MTTTLTAYVAFVAAVAALTCSGAPAMSDQAPSGETHAGQPVIPAFRDAVNGLGFRLYAALARKDESRDVLISTPSIEMALAMTLNGATGETKVGMAHALGLDGLTRAKVNADNAALLAMLRSPDPQVELAVANSLWGREGVDFAPDFIAFCKASYEAKVRSVDFRDPASADAINAWVSSKTKGRIAKLVDAGAVRDALMVLVNAIYFHGTWSVPFDVNLTQDGPFHVMDGSQVTVPLMQRSGRFQYLETEKFQAVALPYGAKNVSAYVFLPKPGVPFAEFRALMQPANWERWMPQFEECRGTVIIPRFKMQYASSLKATLSALGMARAFSDAAEFADMIAPGAAAALGGRPYISDVLHKTMLEVNEKGTTAAAATGVVMRATAMPVERPFVLRADHPFVFAIRDDRSGVILFFGSIANPA